MALVTEGQERTALSSMNGLLPQRRPLPFRKVGREALVRDAENKRVHFLNSTAVVVWQCCDGRTSLFECVRRLQDSFRAPADVDLAADALAAVDGFRQLGLLDEGSGQ